MSREEKRTSTNSILKDIDFIVEIIEAIENDNQEDALELLKDWEDELKSIL